MRLNTKGNSGAMVYKQKGGFVVGRGEVTAPL